MIVNSGYLESLHRPNMRLTFDKIVKVTKSGIVTSEGNAIRPHGPSSKDSQAVQVKPNLM